MIPNDFEEYKAWARHATQRLALSPGEQYLTWREHWRARINQPQLVTRAGG
jgi:hypothetical protein